MRELVVQMRLTITQALTIARPPLRGVCIANGWERPMKAMVRCKPLLRSGAAALVGMLLCNLVSLAQTPAGATTTPPLPLLAPRGDDGF